MESKENLNETTIASISPNEEILNVDNTDIDETDDSGHVDEIIQENNSTATNDSDLDDSLEDNMLEEKNNKINNEIDQKTDCLALTVRDNYHTLVVRNLFKKSARLSLKVTLSVFAINFLNMFL